MVLRKIRDALSSRDVSPEEDYLEIDLEQERKERKVLVRLFMLKDYDDTNIILNALREGYTIGIIDIKTLKKKDPIELKRAISKIKKTAEALEGSIAGFGDIVVVTPSFATIPREVVTRKKEEKKSEYGDF